jgi:hypothetical protein
LIDFPPFISDIVHSLFDVSFLFISRFDAC